MAAEPAAVDDILERCARVPLALTIAAARTATRPGFSLAAVATDLALAEDRLDALDAGEDAARVRAVFSWLYAALSRPAPRLFRLVGVHPGPDVAVAAAARLACRCPRSGRRWPS
ncbi:MAG TPA: hypothetical protein VGP36_17755 [Mycobacteriales bacterium]|nr:hypothetical protein [Mycobacteriales bacterium]